MGFIRSWTSCIIIVVMVMTLAEVIMPEGEIKKTVNLVMGLMSAIIIATPVFNLVKEGFDFEEFFNINEYCIAEGNYANIQNEIMLNQVTLLEKTYSEKILQQFNEKYPEQKIESCDVIFVKDSEGKIEEIERIVVKITEGDFTNIRKRISDISEIAEDKIDIYKEEKEMSDSKSVNDG